MTVKDDLLNTNRPLSDKIGSNAWGWTTKRATVEYVYEAKLMGIKYLRYPYDIARTPTTYADAADTWRYGLQVILDAGIIPIVDFHASNNDKIPNDVETDTMVSYFKNTIEDVVKDNKGKGIVWESWNEAIGAFWSKTPSTPDVMKQITDMHKFIADTVKTNDPNSAFIGPSLDAKELNYKNGVFIENGGELYSYLKAYKDAGSFDVVDAVAIHPYAQVHQNGGNPEQFIKELSTYKDFNGNKPLIPTELGYSVEIPDSVNAIHYSLHDARVKTLRELLIMDMLGCPTMLVYSLGDGNSYSEGSLGKLSNLGEALTSFMNRIKGYTFKERLATTNYTAQGVIDDLYALRYTKEGASDLMVYWSPIPNRYGVVATLPNVTHKLIFQDMPQILAI